MLKCAAQLQLQKWSKPLRCLYLALERCDADHVLPLFSVAKHGCGCAGPGAPFPEAGRAAQAEQCCEMEVPWPGLEGSGSLSGAGE